MLCKLTRDHTSAVLSAELVTDFFKTYTVFCSFFFISHSQKTIRGIKPAQMCPVTML